MNKDIIGVVLTPEVYELARGETKRLKESVSRLERELGIVRRQLLVARMDHGKLIERLKAPIEVADFSVRTYNSLRNAGVKYLGDLVHKTEGDLLRTKNLGRSSLKEVLGFLEHYGLWLDMDVSGWMLLRPDTSPPLLDP